VWKIVERWIKIIFKKIKKLKVHPTERVLRLKMWTTDHSQIPYLGLRHK
jgi:hypothetical protein